MPSLSHQNSGSVIRSCLHIISSTIHRIDATNITDCTSLSRSLFIDSVFIILPLPIYLQYIKPSTIQQRTTNCIILLYLKPFTLYHIDDSKSTVCTSFSCSLFLFVYPVYTLLPLPIYHPIYHSIYHITTKCPFYFSLQFYVVSLVSHRWHNQHRLHFNFLLSFCIFCLNVTTIADLPSDLSLNMPYHTKMSFVPLHTAILIHRRSIHHCLCLVFIEGDTCRYHTCWLFMLYHCLVYTIFFRSTNRHAHSTTCRNSRHHTRYPFTWLTHINR